MFLIPESVTDNLADRDGYTGHSQGSAPQKITILFPAFRKKLTALYLDHKQDSFKKKHAAL